MMAKTYDLFAGFRRGVVLALVAFVVALEAVALAGALLPAAFAFEAGVSPVADRFAAPR